MDERGGRGFNWEEAPAPESPEDILENLRQSGMSDSEVLSVLKDMAKRAMKTEAPVLHDSMSGVSRPPNPGERTVLKYIESKLASVIQMQDPSLEEQTINYAIAQFQRMGFPESLFEPQSFQLGSGMLRRSGMKQIETVQQKQFQASRDREIKEMTDSETIDDVLDGPEGASENEGK